MMQKISVRVDALRPLITRRQPQMEMKDMGPKPFPAELVEKILNDVDDASTLVKTRPFGRHWVKIADRKLRNFTMLYIDVMRVELAGTRLIIQLEAEPFKFAYILPLLRWFDSGESRSCSVVHLKDHFEKKQKAKWYYHRLCLSCDLSELETLSTLMATFPVRIFYLQSLQKWEGQCVIPLTVEMMDVLESLFSHWKLIHTAVCLDRKDPLHARFDAFMRRTQMLSAYKCEWGRGWGRYHPFTFQRMPETFSEQLHNGPLATWLARLSKKTTLTMGTKEAYRIEFGDELRSLVIPRVERGDDYNIFKATISSNELYLEKSIEAMRANEIHSWERKEIGIMRWCSITTTIAKVFLAVFIGMLAWHVTCMNGNSRANCGEGYPSQHPTYHMRIADGYGL